MEQCTICETEITEAEFSRQAGLCRSCALLEVETRTTVLPRYQTYFKRTCALTIDGFILSAIYALCEAALRLNTSRESLLLMFLLGYATILLYAPIMHWRFGQTLGKMALQVKVFSTDEVNLISLPRALLRDIPQIVRFPLAVYAIYHTIYLPSQSINSDILKAYERLDYFVWIWLIAELITMAFNNKRRAIHDYISGSVVINLEHYDQPK